MIAVTFLGSAIAAAILPWRKREIYNASPIAKYKVLGHPADHGGRGPVHRFPRVLHLQVAQRRRLRVNDHGSLIYMGCLYGVALAIYVGSRIVRRAQGMDMSMVYGEIPAE